DTPAVGADSFSATRRRSRVTIVTITEGPGAVGLEGYEATYNALYGPGADPNLRRPLVHVAGPSEGGWRVINIWASQEDVDAAVKALDALPHRTESMRRSLKRSLNPVHRLIIEDSRRV